jgi:chromosome partitioning protein
VGMRLDARTRAAGRLDAWAAQNGLPYIGSIREAQVYPRSAEQGLTLFDMPPAKVAADLAQWQPIVDWIGAAWLATEQLETTAKASSSPISAPSLAKQAKRRTLVRAPLAVAKAPLADFRPVPWEAVHPARAERFGWLLTVFRSRS